MPVSFGLPAHAARNSTALDASRVAGKAPPRVSNREPALAGARSRSAAMRSGLQEVDLLVPVRLERLAGQEVLRVLEEDDHRSAGHVPVLRLLDLDAQQGDVRVVLAIGEPGLVRGLPELV